MSIEGEIIRYRGGTDRSWSRWGACRGMDPDFFFPTESDDTGLETAKRVCASCPVRVDCLDYAMVNRERLGVWGGLSESERSGVRSKRRANK